MADDAGRCVKVPKWLSIYKRPTPGLPINLHSELLQKYSKYFTVVKYDMIGSSTVGNRTELTRLTKMAKAHFPSFLYTPIEVLRVPYREDWLVFYKVPDTEVEAKALAQNIFGIRNVTFKESEWDKFYQIVVGTVEPFMAWNPAKGMAVMGSGPVLRNCIDPYIIDMEF